MVQQAGWGAFAGHRSKLRTALRTWLRIELRSGLVGAAR
ncbi:hypothetical protein ACPOL_5203 [Acidisarcina polymorpha]|uniref:Uncharacterized protein n=1 Tax=Acidisarcina polymorpha TaxID=2211140 RepID=A0A2Z5G6P1_9BACT|nr:hypothetical protein ACPOL_5203 [Acidisarcina polymorpha]